MGLVYTAFVPFIHFIVSEIHVLVCNYHCNHFLLIISCEPPYNLPSPVISFNLICTASSTLTTGSPRCTVTMFSHFSGSSGPMHFSSFALVDCPLLVSLAIRVFLFMFESRLFTGIVNYASQIHPNATTSIETPAYLQGLRRQC